MEHEPVEGALGWLDGPRLVVGAFAFFLCGLTILGILLWSDQRKQVDRIDEITAAANRDAVQMCFADASQGPALRQVLATIEGELQTEEAKQALRNYRQLNAINAPTVRECRQLAQRLHVPIPKGVNG